MNKKRQHSKFGMRLLKRWLRFKAFRAYKDLVRRVEYEIGGELHAC